MKIKDLKFWSGIGINEEFSCYEVCGTDGETYLVSGNALNGIENKEYCFDYFDTDSYYEFVDNELVKNSMVNKYLVFAIGYGWRNKNGYKFTESVRDALSVDYDNEFYIEGTSRGEKSILLKEYSHDNPMGCHWLIVSLTGKEFSKLYWSGFETVETFAKDQLKRIVTGCQKEKYKAMLGG